MAIDYSSVSEKIFNILSGQGLTVEKRDIDGKITSEVDDARYFSVKEPEIQIFINEEESTINMKANKANRDTANEIRPAIKSIATEYNLNLDYKLFSKKRIPKQVESKEQDVADVMEGFGTMYGGAKTSYQPLDNVKIVVKHRNAVNEESRGARSRNIHSIYIQRGEERFKMAENNLKAARAMARHLNMGGETFDSVGTAIVEMAAEQRKLKEFTRYVSNRGLVNESNEEYVILAQESISSIKTTLDKLCGVKTYAKAVESLEDMANTQILEDDIDLEAKFTETHIDDRVTSAFDGIKRSLSRQQNYRTTIENAIANESFSELCNSLTEAEAVDFATPHARLSYQVGRLGAAAKNETLRNHLNGISQRIADGQRLGQFEYDTIKSCLLSASEARIQENVTESAENAYASFIEGFDIF